MTRSKGNSRFGSAIHKGGQGHGGNKQGRWGGGGGGGKNDPNLKAIRRACDQGRVEEAIRCFDALAGQGKSLDDVAKQMLLKATIAAGRFQDAGRILKLSSTGFQQGAPLNPATLTQLVLMMPQRCDLTEAAEFCDMALSMARFDDGPLGEGYGEGAKEFYRRTMRLSLLEFLEEVIQSRCRCTVNSETGRILKRTVAWGSV